MWKLDLEPYTEPLKEESSDWVATKTALRYAVEKADLRLNDARKFLHPCLSRVLRSSRLRF